MNEKIENSLNLALSISEEQLEKSQGLNAGFNSLDNSWDLIVRYNKLDEAEKIPGIKIHRLRGNYAIITIKEEYIDELANLSEIIYIEMPNILKYQVLKNRSVVCVSSIQIQNWYTKNGIMNEQGLFGEGTIVGIVDSGIDFTNSVFRNEDGTTRILELWDQTTDTVYSESMINQALSANNPYEIVNSRDFSGHGTAVASIAAGNFSSDKSTPLGIAPKAHLLVVKLGNKTNYNPLTSELMMAIDFVVSKAIDYKKPLSLNISQGNNYGSHDGSSLLSTYIDDVVDDHTVSIQIGAGNEGDKGIHFEGYIMSNEEQEIEVLVGNYQQSFSLSIWKDYADEFNVAVEAPGGAETSLIREDTIINENIEGVTLHVIYGMPRPYSKNQEIFMQFVPDNAFVTPGVWKIRLFSQNVKQGKYNIWVQDNSEEGVRFLKPNAETTITEPGTTQNVISVGAFDSYGGVIPAFSGQGFDANEIVKPDIVAPGVNILAAGESGLSYFTGTSMAAPFVTGIAALMMEWGIVRGNDRFLYGEKLKAFLQKGAVSVSNITQYPDTRAGFGLVCAKNSF